jgi:adenylate cyclase
MRGWVVDWRPPTLPAAAFAPIPPQPSLLSQVVALFGRAGPGTCGSPRAACPARKAGRTPCHVALQLQAEQARGREMEKAFSQYVSPQVIERLMADPEGVSRGGEARDVTVLFADIRGFTMLAEAMKDDPAALGELVGEILDPLSEIVLAHGGTIDKYMGDCLMAFWGAPNADPDHARQAFEAAKAMLAAMTDVNACLSAAFDGRLPPIEIGIGVNSGECVVGNLGSRRRFDYSVLGDPVNVASRLQGLCKAYDAPLLMGEETARRLGPDAGLKEIDRVVVRGRREPQGLFGLAIH